MEILFMKKYPSHYITIVNEIENYIGASIHTDQIFNRVNYRIKQLYGGNVGALTSPILKIIARKAACEILKTKRQNEVLTDFDSMTMYADNVQKIDDQIADNDLINDIILMAKNDDERFIISAWRDGFSDSQIARTLAEQKGGLVETHRSKVRRYKNRLRNEKVYKVLKRDAS